MKMNIMKFLKFGENEVRVLKERHVELIQKFLCCLWGSNIAYVILKSPGMTEAAMSSINLWGLILSLIVSHFFINPEKIKEKVKNYKKLVYMEMGMITLAIILLVSLVNISPMIGFGLFNTFVKLSGIFTGGADSRIKAKVFKKDAEIWSDITNSSLYKAIEIGGGVCAIILPYLNTPVWVYGVIALAGVIIDNPYMLRLHQRYMEMEAEEQKVISIEERRGDKENPAV